MKMKYTKEKEQEYYNTKLIKESIKDSSSRPHKLSVLDTLVHIIGTVLGFIIQDIIDTDKLISNGVLRFFADVIIIVIAITAVNVISNLLFTFGKEREL